MKMIRPLITLLLVLLICAGAYAQPSTRDTSNSLLWRISDRHQAKPSYLFGTMHLICSGDFIWTEAMKRALAESDKVCFEMNLNDPTLMTEITTGLMNTNGKKLEDYFTPEQYSIVKRYLKDSLGMDISIFQHMKPIVLESIFASNGTGCPNPVSYEDSIMKTALRDKKEIMGLEDTKESLALMDRIPTDTVIKELVDEIQNNDKSDSDMRELTNAYKNQDLQTLYTLITTTKGMDDDMGIFLDERNLKWIPRIADKMGSASVFFAVGAGHLWGEKGVITLLRKQGFNVEPIR